MATLYLECLSGISGDMTVAALLDLGADEQVLRRGLESLGVSGYRLAVSRVSKSGIEACDFDVILEEVEHHHHHDHEEKAHTHTGSHHGHSHSHGGHQHAHEHPHSHSHSHEETPHHGGEAQDHAHHTHEHGHSHGEHSHEHRNVVDINAIIDGSAITPRAKELAKGIFQVVARAEAVVHGKPVEEVHFHEVGAVDSIVDIVGAAICLDNLGVNRVICSPLREGTGTIRCQHGVIPVPAPATLEIARANGVPLVITDNSGEMVTPTGAAIVAALADSFGAPEEMTVRRIGYGAGKREYKTANVLRAMLVEEQLPAGGDRVVKLECNLDDMTGEELGWACEELLAAGALDVWTAPIYMKKSRPAHMLSVLARPRDEEALTRLLLERTSTIGVRRSEHGRTILSRREITIDTPHGPVAAKESSGNGICKTKVEFESAKALAKEKNLPVKQILDAAYTEWNRKQ